MRRLVLLFRSGTGVYPGSSWPDKKADGVYYDFFGACVYTNKGTTGIVYTYMGTSQNDDEKKPVPPEQSTVVLLLGTIGDTTWRMFVPTIGLTVLGLLADKQFHTTPWIMTTGIIAGALLAYVLVRRQIKKVKNDE